MMKESNDAPSQASEQLPLHHALGQISEPFPPLSYASEKDSVASDSSLPQRKSVRGRKSTTARGARWRGSPGSKDGESVGWLSLPNKSQLFILAICRLSEPLSNTCLLPYLYYLIRHLQAESGTTAQISRRAGVVVSLFALSQFATSMLWARVADRWGRKPVILVGLLASILSNLGFGFAKSIPAIMFWRVLAGIGNGNVGVMRTMTAEIVREKKYQSRAFLLLPLVFNTGVIIGLALGGCLANPTVNMKWLFGPQGYLNFSADPVGVSWTIQHPYALPTVFNALALSCGFILALGGLRETLPQKAHDKDAGLVLASYLYRLLFRRSSQGYEPLPPSTATTSSVEKGLPEPRPTLPATSTLRPTETWTPLVLSTLLSFSLLPLHNATFMQLFPHFLSSPLAPAPAPASRLFFTGGLHLPSSTIGLLLSSFGVLGIFLQLLIYPRLQAAIGTLAAYRLALWMFPFAYIAAPYLARMQPADPLRWAGVCAMLCVQVTARTFAIPSSVILLTNVAPRPSALGRIHGAGNMVSSLSRAVGPAVGGWVFAWGVERGCVGFVWWAYLALIAAVAAVQSYRLREVETWDREGVKSDTRDNPHFQGIYLDPSSTPQPKLLRWADKSLDLQIRLALLLPKTMKVADNLPVHPRNLRTFTDNDVSGPKVGMVEQEGFCPLMRGKLGGYGSDGTLKYSMLSSKDRGWINDSPGCARKGSKTAPPDALSSLLDLIGSRTLQHSSPVWPAPPQLEGRLSPIPPPLHPRPLRLARTGLVLTTALPLRPGQLGGKRATMSLAQYRASASGCLSLLGRPVDAGADVAAGLLHADALQALQDALDARLPDVAWFSLSTRERCWRGC
ncbi:MAG: hypothetical protein M1829_004260 [Trizodia sp. TS-e1964]|nr:MAG: hypothetical protein M1829_004260 [Trizodia sp. TS-e1964]